MPARISPQLRRDNSRAGTEPAVLADSLDTLSRHRHSFSFNVMAFEMAYRCAGRVVRGGHSADEQLWWREQQLQRLI
jgi:hypothetical protein